MTSGSDYVIIAARRPVAVALQAILRDWASGGLINPCLVVDLDALREDNPALPALRLDRSNFGGVSIQQDLAQQRAQQIRLAVVGVVDQPETQVNRDAAVRMQTALQETLPGAPTTLVSLSAGSPKAQWRQGSLVMIGWHNLALSPEQSQAPGRPASALTVSTTDPAWYMLLAGSLASLLSLWPGQKQSPLDGTMPPSGELLTPVRLFSRSLSSGSVQQVLGARLISVSERYPAPYYDRSLSGMADDEAQRAMEMGEKLFAKHSYMMPRVRHASAPEPRMDIGVGQAVINFLRFLGDSLRRAPSEFVRAANRAVAQKVQDVVYGGSDSSYTVVVGGVRADGSSASWTDYEASLESVMSKTLGASQEAELPPVPALHQLWTDYVAAGMTLLDAGERVEELPPIRIGQQRAIVATTDRVAPDPREVFQLPASLAAFLPNWSIQPGDDIEVGRLFDQLARLSKAQPHLAQEISNESNRLRRWAEQARASYSGHVGRRLADAHRSVIEELGELNQRVELLGSRPPASNSTKELEDNLAMKIGVLSGVCATVFAMFVTFVVFGLFTWPWLIPVFFLLVIGWVTIGAWFHMASSRQVYALLNRRLVEATELADAKRHRVEALEDLRRISRGYRQYLDWARVLGAFVHTPLGKPEAYSESMIKVGQGLPANLAIGLAKADESATDDVANRYRSQLFPAGWLSGPWREFQEISLPELGRLDHQLSTDRAQLLAMDPIIEGKPVLTQWSTALVTVAANRPMSAAIKRQIEQLTLSNSQALNRLLTRVQVCDARTGEPREVNRVEFISGLDAADGTMDSFQSGMFSPDASELDLRRVQHTAGQAETTGLDEAIVVVQFGGSYSADQFAGDAPELESTFEIHDSGDFV